LTYDALRWGRYSESGRIYHVVCTTAGRWAIFNDFSLARELVCSMRNIAVLGALDSLAWVVMPDHVHWLFSLGDGRDLSRVMGEFKGVSARGINRSLGRRGRVWQRGFYDHALRREEDLADVARYIVANPLRAGLATRLGDYPHWDARWL